MILKKILKRISKTKQHIKWHIKRKLKWNKLETPLYCINLTVVIICTLISAGIIFRQTLIMQKQNEMAEYQNNLSALEYMPIFNIKLANNDGDGKITVTNEGFRATNLSIEILRSLSFIYRDSTAGNKTYTKEIFYHMSTLDSVYYNIDNSQSYEFNTVAPLVSPIESFLYSSFNECYNNILLKVQPIKSYGKYVFEIQYGEYSEMHPPFYYTFYRVIENIYLRITYEDAFAVKHTEYYTLSDYLPYITDEQSNPERDIVRMNAEKIHKINLDENFDKISHTLYEYSQASSGLLNELSLLSNHKDDVLKFLKKYKCTTFP